MQNEDIVMAYISLPMRIFPDGSHVPMTNYASVRLSDTELHLLSECDDFINLPQLFEAHLKKKHARPDFAQLDLDDKEALAREQEAAAEYADIRESRLIRVVPKEGKSLRHSFRRRHADARRFTLRTRDTRAPLFYKNN